MFITLQYWDYPGHLNNVRYCTITYNKMWSNTVMYSYVHLSRVIYSYVQFALLYYILIVLPTPMEVLHTLLYLTVLSTIKAYNGYQPCHRILWINPAAVNGSVLNRSKQVNYIVNIQEGDTAPNTKQTLPWPSKNPSNSPPKA